MAELEDGKLLLRAHNKFLDTGEYLLQEELLTFRHHETITKQLARTSWEATATWGDWHQTPLVNNEPIMVFEARAS